MCMFVYSICVRIVCSLCVYLVRLVRVLCMLSKLSLLGMSVEYRLAICLACVWCSLCVSMCSLFVTLVNSLWVCLM